MRKRFAIIISLTLILSLLPVSISSAAVSKPGKVKKITAKAASAPPKVGKGTVTVKWKKVTGATHYQIFVQRADSKWKRAKTVKGSKSSAKIKAYVGKNKVRVRAVRKIGGQTSYGKFSKSKTVTVKSKRTVEKYMKAHPEELKEITSDSEISIKFRDNDILFIYDLADLIDDEEYITSEVKRKLRDGLEENKDTFIDTCDTVEQAVNVRGVRLIVKYVYNGKFVTQKIFS